MPDPSEIEIPPPREPEVNPEIYKDVAPLLAKGFLMLPAEINGILFVFKSLNQHEYEMLGLMGGLRHEKAPTQTFWNMFLAYGVYMVDGTNVIDSRDRSMKEIARAFADFTPGARSKLIRHLSELNRRANVATILTEAYVTESYSRYRWAQVKGLDLMSPTVTGIAGTEKIGLNYAQLTWRALNYYEDLQDTMEREWENAKFVGACMAGKGIQKVNHADERRRAKQKEMLFSRKDAVIRYALFGDPLDGDKLKDGKIIIAARTTEELSAQLQASLRGEKDWHDQVVESYEQQIRDRYTAQEQKLKEMLASHKEDFGDQNVVGGTNLQGLSPAEVHERMTRRKQFEAQQLAKRVLYPQLDERSDVLHQKWGLTDSEVSTTFSQTDRDPSEAVPITPPTAPGRPFRR
jgi:hypothetical protein